MSAVGSPARHLISTPIAPARHPSLLALPLPAILALPYRHRPDLYSPHARPYATDRPQPNPPAPATLPPVPYPQSISYCPDCPCSPLALRRRALARRPRLAADAPLASRPAPASQPAWLCASFALPRNTASQPLACQPAPSPCQPASQPANTAQPYRFLSLPSTDPTANFLTPDRRTTPYLLPSSSLVNLPLPDRPDTRPLPDLCNLCSPALQQRPTLPLAPSVAPACPRPSTRHLALATDRPCTSYLHPALTVLIDLRPSTVVLTTIIPTTLPAAASRYWLI